MFTSIVVRPFAEHFIATLVAWAVAKYGFNSQEGDTLSACLMAIFNFGLVVWRHYKTHTTVAALTTNAATAYNQGASDQKAGMAMPKSNIVGLFIGALIGSALIILPLPVSAESPNLQPYLSLASNLWANTEAHVGAGITLHGNYGESLSQQLDLVDLHLLFTGQAYTNGNLVAGITHETLFANDKNHERLGVGISGYWVKAPHWTKVLMFNANDITYGGGFAIDADDLSRLHFRPNVMGFYVFVGRPIGH